MNVRFLFSKILSATLSVSLIVPARAALPSPVPVRVVHIQDIHRHPEAQRNISRLIQTLAKTDTVDTLALEGAFAPIDVAPFQKFPVPGVVNEMAGAMLEIGELPAGGYAALVTRIPAVGVDDEEKYRANIAAVKAAARVEKTAKENLAMAAQRLALEKQRTLNVRLAAFDRAVEAYRVGRLPVKKFALELRSHTPAVGPETALFIAVAEMEPLLKIAQAKAGNVAELNRFRTYLTLVNRLDVPTFFSELDAMEKNAVRALARKRREKALMAASRKLYLTAKLIDLALTSEEWEEYETPPNPPTGRRGEELRPFEDFYRFAEARDEKIADNVLKLSGNVVLVTGGFHAAGIDRRLGAAGVKVETKTPRVTRIDADAGAAALSSFVQEKTPLDRLFDGEKIFLSPEPFDASTRGRLAVLSAAWAYLKNPFSETKLARWLGRAFNWSGLSWTVLSASAIKISIANKLKSVTIRFPESLRSHQPILIASNTYIPLQATELALVAAPVWFLLARHLTALDFGLLYAISFLTLLAFKNHASPPAVPALAFAGAGVQPQPEVSVDLPWVPMEAAGSVGDVDDPTRYGWVIIDDLGFIYEKNGLSIVAKSLRTELNEPTRKELTKRVRGVDFSVGELPDGSLAWGFEDTDDNLKILAKSFGLRPREMRVYNPRVDVGLRLKKGPEMQSRDVETLRTVLIADFLDGDQTKIPNGGMDALSNELLKLRKELLVPQVIEHSKHSRLDLDGTRIPFYVRPPEDIRFGPCLAFPRSAKYLRKIFEAAKSPLLSKILSGKPDLDLKRTFSPIRASLNGQKRPAPKRTDIHLTGMELSIVGVERWCFDGRLPISHFINPILKTLESAKKNIGDTTLYENERGRWTLTVDENPLTHEKSWWVADGDRESFLTGIGLHVDNTSKLLLTADAGPRPTGLPSRLTPSSPFISEILLIAKTTQENVAKKLLDLFKKGPHQRQLLLQHPVTKESVVFWWDGTWCFDKKDEEKLLRILEILEVSFDAASLERPVYVRPIDRFAAQFKEQPTVWRDALATKLYAHLPQKPVAKQVDIPIPESGGRAVHFYWMGKKGWAFDASDTPSVAKIVGLTLRRTVVQSHIAPETAVDVLKQNKVFDVVQTLGSIRDRILPVLGVLLKDASGAAVQPGNLPELTRAYLLNLGERGAGPLKRERSVRDGMEFVRHVVGNFSHELETMSKIRQRILIDAFMSLTFDGLADPARMKTTQQEIVALVKQLSENFPALKGGFLKRIHKEVVSLVTTQLSFNPPHIQPADDGGQRLFPHQRIGAYRMNASAKREKQDTVKTFGFLNSDDTRLGKCLQTFAALDPAWKTFLLVPAKLIDTWESEFKKHVKPGKMRFVTLRGTPKQKRALIDAYENEKNVILIASLEDMRMWPAELVAKATNGVDTLVVDEAHKVQNFKDDEETASRQANLVHSISARTKWFLSATPFTSSEDQLYSKLRAIHTHPETGEVTNPAFATLREFRRHKRRDPSWLFGQILRVGLRRVKDSFGNLYSTKEIVPPETEGEYDMTDEQSEFVLRLIKSLRQYLKEFNKRLPEDKRIPDSSISLFLKLKFLDWASTSPVFLGEKKMPTNFWNEMDARVLPRLTRADPEKRKGIIICKNRVMVDAVVERYQKKGFKVARIDGTVSGRVRMDQDDDEDTEEWTTAQAQERLRFQNNPDVNLIVINEKAGEGISLDKAAWELFAQLPENYVSYYQTVDRGIGLNPSSMNGERKKLEVLFMLPRYSKAFLKKLEAAGEARAADLKRARNGTPAQIHYRLLMGYQRDHFHRAMDGLPNGENGDSVIRRIWNVLPNFHDDLAEQPTGVLFPPTGYQSFPTDPSFYSRTTVRKAYEEANAALKSLLGSKAFDVETFTRSPKEILLAPENIEKYHAAITAFQIASFRVWRKGHRAEVSFLGASRGGSAAYYLSGAMSLKDALELSIRNARYLKAAAEITGRAMGTVSGLSSDELESELENVGGVISVEFPNGRAAVSLPAKKKTAFAKRLAAKGATVKWPPLIGTSHDPAIVDETNEKIAALKKDYYAYLDRLKSRLSKPKRALFSSFEPGVLLETPEAIIYEEHITLEKKIPLKLVLSRLLEGRALQVIGWEDPAVFNPAPPPSDTPLASFGFALIGMGTLNEFSLLSFVLSLPVWILLVVNMIRNRRPDVGSKNARQIYSEFSDGVKPSGQAPVFVPVGLPASMTISGERQTARRMRQGA